MNIIDDSERSWNGRAFCRLSTDRPEFQDGFRGAYVVVACRAASAGEAVSLIESELLESDLMLSGFDYLFDIASMDRDLTEYEIKLNSRLSAYPIQFENVHFFKPDA